MFRYYHSDAGSAVSAGHDVRTALLCFGTDASHGYERTHMSVLVHLAELLALYMQSGPAVNVDREAMMASVERFSPQRDAEPFRPAEAVGGATVVPVGAATMLDPHEDAGEE